MLPVIWKKKKTLRLKNYKYPSLEESIKNDVNVYERFDFEYTSILESTIYKELSIEKGYNLENLYHWNIVFSNKLGKLTQTHLFLKTHFKRGFNEDYLKCNEVELADRALFDYYIEIFYYYYFSAIEILAKIIALYFEIEFKNEESSSFNKNLIEKINQPEIKQRLSEFNKSIFETKEIRNKFTHRFPVNEKDFRLEKTETDSISKGFGKIIKTEEIYNNIESLSKLLQLLIIDLKLFFDNNKKNNR